MAMNKILAIRAAERLIQVAEDIKTAISTDQIGEVEPLMQEAKGDLASIKDRIFPEQGKV